MTYSQRWSRTWLVAEALGVGLSLLVWHPVPGLVVLVVLTSFAATMLVVLETKVDGTPRTSTSRTSTSRTSTSRTSTSRTSTSRTSTARSAAQLAVLAWALASGVVSVVATADVFWPVTVLALTAAAASSPWVVVRLRRAAHRQGTGAGSALPTTAELDLGSTLEQLSTAALCDAWKRSFAALMCARTAQQRMVVVEVRAQYLDEMERRCPGGFSAWLASGALAAGGPDRFLADGAVGEADAP